MLKSGCKEETVQTMARADKPGPQLGSHKTKLEERGDHADGENSTVCYVKLLLLGAPQSGEKQLGCAWYVPNSPKAALRQHN